MRKRDILPAETSATTIEVEVDELCTNTVVSTPIIRATILFCSSALSDSARPFHSIQGEIVLQ
jgi:hypothetical protein